ncbi:ditrans,polycis-polyprenyl diphosphate synthase [Chloropicon primus]|uniref:Alkyl transferase n=2 Tax=Chloropicon primus TaxID=1764295 RepID=A0A5B8MNL5_9CHLO|nr:ditrans,polycis-polyprenyl diphosphate synthase [Chloropicon primus]UPR00140.1 ditrans,polycis-polyprenyl diphosphate synthase [Chloropicon primus]|eukprot:QDZ20930.1 ditrans,polycis-polyprenyl diphosphate synthase [Chloropicon primus]
MSSLVEVLMRVVRAGVLKVLSSGPIPAHLGIIMDGNRRYATRRKLHTTSGHLKGFDKLHEMLFWLLDVGIRNVSVYAFSIDNFKRTEDEVRALMDLAHEKFQALLNDMDLIHRYQVRVLVTGDLARVPVKVGEAAESLMEATRKHSKCVLNICFAYTGCYDIGCAVKAVAGEVERGEVDPSEVDGRLVRDRLLTHGMPPVDLLLRTSGEKRLSDFLPWQCGGAHLAFIDTLWPELSLWDLAQVILEYQDTR